MASANPGGGTARSVSLDMLSINNLARVEVVFSPTPDNPGAALAGAVNMIPRGAFERARPVLNRPPLSSGPNPLSNRFA